MESETSSSSANVGGICASYPHSLIESHEDKTWDHPAPKMVPVAPAGADVEHCHGKVGDFEELISGVSDHAFRAEDGQEEDEEQSDTAEDHVKLVQPCSIDLWLGLVELSFNDRPTDGANGGLDEDDAAAPSVQEVEVLMRDAGNDGEDALAGTEQDGQGRESVGEGADTV
jgi:hypothetical protein